MKINELMINDRVVVNHGIDSYKGKIVGISTTGGVTVENLSTKETEVVKDSGLSELFLDEKTLQDIGFSERKVSAQDITKTVLDNDYIIILENPENSEDFYMLTMKRTSTEWRLEIQNRNYITVGSGLVKYAHDLQNFTRLVTKLELHIA